MYWYNVQVQCTCACTYIHIYISFLVPIPMFILGPTSTDCQTFFDGITSDGGELTDNITCLGKIISINSSSAILCQFVDFYAVSLIFLCDLCHIHVHICIQCIHVHCTCIYI